MTGKGLEVLDVHPGVVICTYREEATGSDCKLIRSDEYANDLAQHIRTTVNKIPRRNKIVNHIVCNKASLPIHTKEVHRTCLCFLRLSKGPPEPAVKLAGPPFVPRPGPGPTNSRTTLATVLSMVLLKTDVALVAVAMCHVPALLPVLVMSLRMPPWDAFIPCTHTQVQRSDSDACTHDRMRIKQDTIRFSDTMRGCEELKFKRNGSPAKSHTFSSAGLHSLLHWMDLKSWVVLDYKHHVLTCDWSTLAKAVMTLSVSDSVSGSSRPRSSSCCIDSGECLRPDTSCVGICSSAPPNVQGSAEGKTIP